MLKKCDFILLKNFLQKYDYTEKELEYINKYFGEKNVTCILQQIYAALNMLPKEENEYLIVFNHIIENFDLGCNILEVASGNYPVLAQYIDKYQTKIGKGTITVIDPKLSVKELGNIHLIKDSFNYGDNVKPYDLIISQSPCLKLDDIVVSAINNNKQFFVTMCRCIYDRYPYLSDYYFDDEGFDPIFNKLHGEMCKLNEINKQTNLKIDSSTIFYDYEEIKYFTGKKLIKK